MNFEQWIMENEPTIRLSFFVGVFGLVALLELLSPRRQLLVNKAVRWANNLSLVVFNTVMLRLIFPTAAVGVALFAQQQGWGLFNYFEVPLIVAVLLSIIALDMVIYLQHVLVHAVPALWRLHRVHHADLDYDVTTGARFHPIEIIVSMLIKFAALVVLGAPVVAVIIFEVLLNAMAMFNHGNLRLPKALDAVLRLFVVTPDMHRVHHSTREDEANSNFGFNLSLWDRIFATYRAQPELGHEAMDIGIEGFSEKRDVTYLPGLLTLPFKGKITRYAINRRQWD